MHTIQSIRPPPNPSKRLKSTNLQNFPTLTPVLISKIASPKPLYPSDPISGRCTQHLTLRIVYSNPALKPPFHNLKILSFHQSSQFHSFNLNIRLLHADLIIQSKGNNSLLIFVRIHFYFHKSLYILYFSYSS